MVDKKEMDEAKKITRQLLGRELEELEKEHEEVSKRIKELDRRLRNASGQPVQGPSFPVQS